jgi:hypothetical protein
LKKGGGEGRRASEEETRRRRREEERETGGGGEREEEERGERACRVARQDRCLIVISYCLILFTYSGRRELNERFLPLSLSLEREVRSLCCFKVLNCDCPCQRMLIPVAILNTWSIASLQ